MRGHRWLEARQRDYCVDDAIARRVFLRLRICGANSARRRATQSLVGDAIAWADEAIDVRTHKAKKITKWGGVPFEVCVGAQGGGHERG